MVNKVFPLSKGYAEDLERRGLVEIQGDAAAPAPAAAIEPLSLTRDQALVKPDTKAKPVPNNKMAPAPDNKAA